MPYADHLRILFPTLELEVADLFALEAHQIAQLPTRAPDRALAEVLHMPNLPASNCCWGLSQWWPRKSG